jgi:tRNA-dihydrouridine synthase
MSKLIPRHLAPLAGFTDQAFRQICKKTARIGLHEFVSSGRLDS